VQVRAAVAGEKELGIEVWFEPKLLQFFITAQRSGKAIGGEVLRSDAAAKIVAERFAPFPRPVQVPGPAEVIGAGVEEGEVPAQMRFFSGAHGSSLG
jgi:hypothetical protein